MPCWKGRAGQGRVDVRAIADCLQRLSQLVTDFPIIEEMDINPLIVGEIGADPVVADARITLSRSEERGMNDTTPRSTRSGKRNTAT